MSAIVDTAVDQVVKTASAGVDSGIALLDTTQNLVTSTGVQLAEAGDDLGDLAMANLIEAGANFKAALEGYGEALKKLGNAVPLP